MATPSHTHTHKKAVVKKHTSQTTKKKSSSKIKKNAHSSQVKSHNKKTKKSKKKKHARIASIHEQKLRQILAETENLDDINPQMSLVSSIEERLVEFVQKSVTNLRYSSYKFGGTHFDTSRGIYIVDCSAYLDYTLRTVYPRAYSSLVDYTGSEKPNSQHYYEFFTELSDSDNGVEHWNKVEEIEQLQPGDILVFRYKNTRRHANGHVMVVMNKPVRDGDVYSVSVADSASSGHSEDTRASNDSGVGIGTLLLKVNPETGQPSAYAWKIGSRWENNVSFAMGRPMEV